MRSSLTVGITTRNRPVSVNACLASLRLVAHLNPEVLLFDDRSSPPVEQQLTDATRALVAEVLRDDLTPGPIVGRNRLVRRARGAYVLLLDDDARLLGPEAVERAMQVLDQDPSVAAIAFAQAEPDGRPWPVNMQPARAAEPVIIPTFIGFAHLVRRDAFLSVGGYREALEFYGEEKDLGLRLLEAGLYVVYLPSALVVHAPDPAGRDPRRHLRRVARNDCLIAIYNEPLPRVLWMLPARYGLYFRMRHGWKIRDPWGGLWLARELIRRLPSALAARDPVSRRTIARWAELKRGETRYAPVASPIAAHRPD